MTNEVTLKCRSSEGYFANVGDSAYNAGSQNWNDRRAPAPRRTATEKAIGVGALERYLVLSVLGEDQPGIVNELSKAVYAADCNVLDSRMSVLGGECAIILLVAGPERAIRALEETLGRLEQELGLTIISRRTEPRSRQADYVPYTVSAVSIDHPGIIYQLAGFFSSRGINIEDLRTESYPAAHTGVPMFALTAGVMIPSGTRIADLREQLTTFCDDLNIDVTLRPATGRPTESHDAGSG